jgi:hypothetical protein
MLTDLMHADGKRYFFRALDGSVRATLSNRYRVLDHYDLAFTALNVAKEVGGEVIEARLTDDTMRISFTTRSVVESLNMDDGNAHRWVRGGVGTQGNARHLQRIGVQVGDEIPGGDPESVSPIITVSNSETGRGGLSVRIGLLRWVCVNGAIISDEMSKVHTGEAMTPGVYTEKTQAAAAKTIMLQASDTIRAAFSPAQFRKMVDQIRSVGRRPVMNAAEAVDNVVKLHTMTEDERDSLLSHFAVYPKNQYGLGQAVARLAQDTDSAERANDLEEIAGNVMMAK